MSTAYTVTPRARRDLAEIWQYSARNWDENQADTYLRRCTSAFADLADGLAKGRKADDIRLGYFRFVVDSHIVFYRYLDGDSIEIVRILHARMDPSRHL